MINKIRRKHVHKNYLFLLSVVDGNAFWSVHQYYGNPDISIQQAASLFQVPHDKQIEGLIAEASRNEPLEFQAETVEDLTNKMQSDEEVGN